MHYVLHSIVVGRNRTGTHKLFFALILTVINQTGQLYTHIIYKVVTWQGHFFKMARKAPSKDLDYMLIVDPWQLWAHKFKQGDVWNVSVFLLFSLIYQYTPMSEGVVVYSRWQIFTPRTQTLQKFNPRSDGFIMANRTRQVWIVYWGIYWGMIHFFISCGNDFICCCIILVKFTHILHGCFTCSEAWGNHIIAPEPVKQAWITHMNKSSNTTGNCITTKTKQCVHFMQ